MALVHCGYLFFPRLFHFLQHIIILGNNKVSLRLSKLLQKGQFFLCFVSTACLLQAEKSKCSKWYPPKNVFRKWVVANQRPQYPGHLWGDLLCYDCLKLQKLLLSQKTRIRSTLQHFIPTPLSLFHRENMTNIDFQSA